ncbi:hypothetical protein BH23GEM10_BH23GEM10_13210 [soil metagenome]
MHWRCGMKDFETDDESSIWLWVTGIVLLAMVVWVAAELSTGDPSATDPGLGAVIATQAQPRPGPAVAMDSVITPAAFSAWVRDSAGAPEWAGDDAFVQAGLGRLAAALGDLARGAESAEGTELQARVAALRRDLAEHSRARTAAVDAARAAMLEAGAIATELHGRFGAAEDAHNLAAALEAAHELDPAQPLQRQRHRVHRYLDFMAQSLMAITP